ncbi:hypothetical protein ACOACO_12725 [Nocardioides sp. CPCC 205120]|uniref:hypothetical protein n=1 Tax=Nocardioides sp. CPCC 205120 TaxID=3406462 RepID=UPI003B501EDA
MKRIVLVAGVLAGMSSLTACSSETGDDAGPEAGPDGVPTRSSTEVAVGDALELVDGVLVTVSSLEVGGDSGGPWVTASVVVENPTDRETAVPSFGIVCGDEPAVGEYVAGSTLLIGDPLAAGTSAEGTLNLLLPGDTRTGTVPECTTPAYVEVSAVGSIDPDATSARFPLPDDVLAELG